MKCRQFEQEIYLYRELTASQKVIIDNHIKQCASCQKLLEGITVYHAIANDIAEDKPELRNHARLTSNIMQAITLPAQKQNGFTKFFERLFIRYSFVAASLTLIICFLVEQQSVQPQQVVHTSQSTTVKLKTSGMLQNLRNRKEIKLSENITSFYACVKSGYCSNPLSKTLN